MKRRTAWVGSLAAAMLAVSAPSAAAAVGDGLCDSNEHCVYKNDQYSGGLRDMAPVDTDWRNNYFTTGGQVHDAGSSGFNFNTPHYMYRDVGCVGTRWYVAKNTGDSNWGLAPGISGANDQPSSSCLG